MNLQKEFTILIQGKLNQDCLEFYKNNYSEFETIVSTWNDCKFDFSNLPNNFKVIKNDIPIKPGFSNVYLQLVSTQIGLNYVKTPFVIKIRGDEYYSNITKLCQYVKKNKNRIVTSPIYFRHPKDNPLHISDHVIAGLKTNLDLMFSNININEKLCAEENFTRNYLSKKNSNYEKDILKNMIENFEIFDLEHHKPYYISTNSQKIKSHTNFVPEKFKSISLISMIFNSKEKQEELEKLFTK